EHLEDWENQSGEVNTEIRVLRAYESLGTAHEGSISIRKLRISKVQPADLLERSTGGDLPFEYDEEYTQTTFAVQWAPHEIKTFLLYR
ncbi:MAG TPA: glycosyl hydrolase-related protein, partial [Candidatus Lokiarchaeia archaeon]|nr:glycosyl hydrolase-related protein [Candidatus Lokiarchaeia archaeon]